MRLKLKNNKILKLLFTERFRGERPRVSEFVITFLEPSDETPPSGAGERKMRLG